MQIESRINEKRCRPRRQQARILLDIKQQTQEIAKIEEEETIAFEAKRSIERNWEQQWEQLEYIRCHRVKCDRG